MHDLMYIYNKSNECDCYSQEMYSSLTIISNNNFFQFIVKLTCANVRCRSGTKCVFKNGYPSCVPGKYQRIHIYKEFKDKF